MTKAKDKASPPPQHKRIYRRDKNDARSYPVDKMLRGSAPAVRGAKVKL